MEVSDDLHIWLKKKGIVTNYYKKTGNGIRLSEEDSSRLEMGRISALLPKIAYSKPLKNLEVKKNNTSTSRLYNWNAIIPYLQTVGIFVDNDTKALIVAGDRSQVVGVLEQLYRLSFEKNEDKVVDRLEQEIFLSKLSENSSIESAESIVEVIIVILCKEFNLSSRLAAGLLVQKAEYLIKLLSKGLKGEFDSIISYYSVIKAYSDHIQTLLIKDPSEAQILFTYLQPGLRSKNSLVQSKASETILFYHNKLRSLDLSFLDPTIKSSEILQICFENITNKIGNKEVLLKLIFELGKKQLPEVMMIRLMDYCKNSIFYLRFVMEILPEIAKLQYSQLLYSQGIIEFWVDLALKESETDLFNSSNRAFCIGILCDMWKSYPNYIEIQEELAGRILNVIKRATRESSKLLRIMTFGRLFDLLSVFSDAKYPFAPIIYKSLTFCLIENYNEESTREFLLTNMILIFKENPLIPPSVLIEPLVKQSLISKVSSHNLCDFEFFLSISNHPRLSVKDSIIILDFLSKILLNDPLYSKLASRPFLSLCKRFCSCQPIQEYLVKFVVISLSILYKENLPFKEQIIIRQLFLNMIQTIAELNYQELNYGIREKFNTFMNIEGKGVKSKQFYDVFELLGGFITEDNEEIRSDNNAERNIKVFSWEVIPRGRVMSDIDKVRKKRLGIENKRKLSEDRQIKRIFPKKNFPEKQLVALSVENRNYEVMAEPLELDLTRIADESPEDQEMIEIIMKKYSKVNKFLFSKYSSLTKRIAPVATFDKIHEEKNSVSESGFTKLIRENGLNKDLISTEAIKKVYKHLIARLKAVSVTSDNFPELLYLASSYIFTKPPYDSNRLPPAIPFEWFYEQLHNFSTVIPRHYFEYNDPGFGDRDIIRTLNAFLSHDPNTPIPSGYKILQEPCLCIEYKSLSGSPSQNLVIEILDTILFTSLDLHLLMPITTISTQYKVKGTLDIEEAQSLSVKFLNKVEALPGFSKLSPNMKLRVLHMSGTGDAAIETAQLLDDLIYTLEKKSRVLISKVPKSTKELTNQVIKMKEMQKIEDELNEIASENRRLNRKKKIKADLDRLKSENEYKKMIEEQLLKQNMIREKFKELRKKEKMERKKVEIEERILQYKLEKMEKGNSQEIVKEKRHKSQYSFDLNKKKDYNHSPGVKKGMSLIAPRSLQRLSESKKKFSVKKI